MSGKQQASAQRKAGRGGGVNDTLWSDDHKNRCPYFSTTSDARTFGACSFTVHDACRRPAASTVATQLARQCVPTAGAGRLNGRARGAALTSATCNVRRTRDREEPTDDSKQAPPLFPVDDFFSLGHCSLSAVTSLSRPRHCNPRRPAARRGAARRGARTYLHWAMCRCRGRFFDYTRPRTCQPPAQASVPPNTLPYGPSWCLRSAARPPARLSRAYE